MAKTDQRGQMICPRSHSEARLRARSVLCSLSWQKKPRVSPLKDPSGRGRSFPFCLGGLGQEMEQSLEIFMEGKNNGVADFLPRLGLTSVGAPKGSGWIYLTSILRRASAPTCYEPALFPALRD